MLLNIAIVNAFLASGHDIFFIAKKNSFVSFVHISPNNVFDPEIKFSKDSVLVARIRLAEGSMRKLPDNFEQAWQLHLLVVVVKLLLSVSK